MAFELPTLPFPKDATGTPYIASPDASGKYTAASGQWFKNASNIWTPVSAADPLPATDTELQNRLGALLDAAVIDPTASASVIAALKGLIKQLQGDGTAGKSAPVALTGSTVKSDTIINALEIRDTNTHSYSTDSLIILQADLSKAGGEKTLLIINTMDQAVNSNIAYTLGTARRNIITGISTPAASFKFVTRADNLAMCAPCPKFDIDARCPTTAPTTGSVSAYLATKV